MISCLCTVKILCLTTIVIDMAYLDNSLIVNVQILYGIFPSLYTMYRTEKDRTEAWVLFQKRPKDWAPKNQGTVTTLAGTFILCKSKDGERREERQLCGQILGGKKVSDSPHTDVVKVSPPLIFDSP